jgi:3-(3-hydroxy-phenyl)propionate hydroxylase
VCDPDRIVTYVCTKDPYRRWEFKMNPGETAEQMLREETIYSLIDPWTPRGTYELRRAAVYQFHAATAARWQVGRIFIAGDAAHQTPPFLGQGMNAGMRDVINLAWKLPMVVQGVAGEALLETYYEERNAHAHDLVDWAVSIGRLMEHLAEEERCQRDGLPAPEAPPTLKSSGYGQGREQPPIRDGAVLLEQVSDTGSTGYLFSQPLVQRQDEPAVRLDDLLGPGFALVTRAAEVTLSESSQRILERIGARVVSLAGLTEVRGHIDRLFGSHEAAIVRPDRLVFGHTTEDLSLDELIARLGTALSLSAGPEGD